MNSMRTIAERASLSVAELYHRYPSKQQMLVGLLDLTMNDLDARSAAAQEGREAVERVALLVECLALVHTHRRDLRFIGASEVRSLEHAPHASGWRPCAGNSRAWSTTRSRTA